MKATLTFNLPEDEELFDIHFHAPRRYYDMRALHYELKAMAKHGIYNKTLEELAEHLYELTWEYAQ